MSKSIKGTKTEKNLMVAFAGESQAIIRYMLFAHAALSRPQKAGYEQIVKIFTDTAENEKIHARVFLNYLEGGDIEITATYPASMILDTKSNLEAAAAGEKMEWSTTYANFEKIAKEEDFPEIADSFKQVAVAEKFHESRFQKLAKNISNGEVFKKNTPVIWHCINCGYVYEGMEAPKECPSCRHPQAYYEWLVENY
jgi:Rubrerythrin